MKDLLVAEKITKKYQSHLALNEVSISVPEQSVFGLLGPNGAGKTSLIRIINQITGPDSGQIYFNGSPLAAKDVEQIGYLPEERGLYKKMQVGEQALYLAQLKGMEKQEAKTKLREWFAKFDISPWWNKKVEELSKGMAQKVQFIVTVLHEPKLLILDEPFSGFDPINANLVKSEILRLRENGATIVLSTHNMSSVEEICDHIALINQSNVVLSGAVKEIRNNFKEDVYQIQFKGNKIAFTNAMWTGGELLDSFEEDGITTAKIKLLNNTKTNDLLQAVIPHIEIVGLEEIIPSMSEIFIKKVQEKKEAHHE